MAGIPCRSRALTGGGSTNQLTWLGTERPELPAMASDGKAFALVELLARLEAVCRRAVDRPAAALQVGDLSLDLATRRVTRGDVEVDLTPTEFSLLEMLMRYAGQVVTRKMVCEHLWESDWEGTTNVLEVHINRLRGKLQRAG